MSVTALSSYRNYLGIAPVTVDGYVNNSGGITADATSVTVGVLDGVPTASMSAIFLDGPNTEVCALSAYTAPTATIAATTNPHPQGCYIFFQPTASLGATAYLPVQPPKIPDKIDQLYSTAAVGSMVSQVGVAQGLRSSDWSFDGDFYGDTVGYVLGGIFGSEDFTSGTPNIHAFGVDNQGQGQPLKSALYVYDGVNTRVVVGRYNELGLTYDPKALLKYSTKFLGRSSGVVPNGTQSYSTVRPSPSWRSAMTMTSTGVGSNTYIRQLLTFALTLTRLESENIPNMAGIQDPYDSYVGALTASAKLTYLKQDDTILSDYLNGNVVALNLAFLQGTGATEVGLNLQMTQANYDAIEPVLGGKAYNAEDASLTGVANTTDATTAGGGLAPCKVTLRNAIADSIYTGVG